jgi:hypothetical protein
VRSNSFSSSELKSDFLLLCWSTFYLKGRAGVSTSTCQKCLFFTLFKMSLRRCSFYKKPIQVLWNIPQQLIIASIKLELKLGKKVYTFCYSQIKEKFNQKVNLFNFGVHLFCKG